MQKIIEQLGGRQIHRGSIVAKLYGGNYLINQGGSTIKATAIEGSSFILGDRVILTRIDGKNFIIGYRGQKTAPKVVWGFND